MRAEAHALWRVIMPTLDLSLACSHWIFPLLARFSLARTHAQGTPTEEGLQLDAQAALDAVWARPDVDKTRILLLGRSLGGAVSVYIAEQNPDKVYSMFYTAKRHVVHQVWTAPCCVVNELYRS